VVGWFVVGCADGVGASAAVFDDPPSFVAESSRPTRGGGCWGV
jgi:hypothetical protein